MPDTSRYDIISPAQGVTWVVKVSMAFFNF